MISVVTDISSATEIFADMQPEEMSAAASREEVGLRYIHGLDQFVVDGVPVPHAHLSPMEHLSLIHI